MTKMSAPRLIAATACFFPTCLAIPASAQDDVRPDYIQSLEACQQVSADAARLACMDAAVSAIVTASREGDLRMVDGEDVRQTRRRLFGFSLPDLDIFGGDDGEDDELDMLESTITAVRYTASDAFQFKIAEGDALWQVSNAPARLRRVEVGDAVVFKKASLGSYFIRIDDQIGVKGKRVE